MNQKKEKDIVADYTDHLLGLGGGLTGELDRHDQVSGLLQLADHLNAILVPVKPEANYRRRLHGDLILKAQQREEMPTYSLFRQHRKGILIGAAVGSAASVVGVAIAVFLRRKQGVATG
ncbi:MAG: hypothetical protein PVJ34_20475 [Anaerolineae bacterium]|jgi:hypothetical protein